LLALVVVAIGGGFYVLGIALGDHVTFREGDVAYTIVVTSKTVRNLPRFAAAGQAAAFTYSARDGTAPGQIILTYSSQDAVAELDRKYRDHCTRQGYDGVLENRLFLEKSRLGCDAFDYRIEFEFQRRATATLVTVVFLER